MKNKLKIIHLIFKEEDEINNETLEENKWERTSETAKNATRWEGGSCDEHGKTYNVDKGGKTCNSLWQTRTI